MFFSQNKFDVAITRLPIIFLWSSLRPKDLIIWSPFQPHLALADPMSGLTTLATLAAQACQSPATHGFGSCSPLPRMCFPLSGTPPTDTAAPFPPCGPPCKHHLLRKSVLGTLGEIPSLGFMLSGLRECPPQALSTIEDWLSFVDLSAPGGRNHNWVGIYSTLDMCQEIS